MDKTETPSDPPTTQRSFPNSPSWMKDTRLFVLAWLVVGLVATVVFFRSVVVMVMMAVVLALIVRPLVDALDQRLPLPRWAVTLLIFLVLVGGFAAIPISAVPTLLRQIAALVANLPDLIAALVDRITEQLSQPISILGGRYTIPVNELTLTTFEEYVQGLLGTIGPSLTSVSGWAGSLASVTIGFLSQTVLVMFVAYYLTKDGHVITTYVLDWAGDRYRDDITYLISRIGLIWGAFLRGQLMLMLTMGFVVFLVSAALGLPNPAVLGAIAGLMEVVPYAGPVLAAIPGLLLAFFQSDSSWLGALMTPLLFTLVVGFAYWLVQQLENYFLLPRIMGHQLNLHPIVVVLGAIIGWQLAGIVGVFLAAPVLATLRLLLGYIYGKLTDRQIDTYDLRDVRNIGRGLAPKVSWLDRRVVPVEQPVEPDTQGESAAD